MDGRYDPAEEADHRRATSDTELTPQLALHLSRLNPPGHRASLSLLARRPTAAPLRSVLPSTPPPRHPPGEGSGCRPRRESKRHRQRPCHSNRKRTMNRSAHCSKSIRRLVVVAIAIGGAILVTAAGSKPGGTLDPSFGGGGKVVANFASGDHFWGVVVQPDGKVVAGGSIS